MPFGEVYEDFGSAGFVIGNPSQDGIVWSVPFRFPGQYQDPEDELYNNIYYNWHRWYMPGLGRYNRADPILTGPPYTSIPFIFPAVNSMNIVDFYSLFIFANNNPVFYSDPTGLFTWKIPPAACRNMHRIEQLTKDTTLGRHGACEFAHIKCKPHCSIFLDVNAECDKYFGVCISGCLKGKVNCMKGKKFAFPDLLWDACRNVAPKECRCKD